MAAITSTDDLTANLRGAVPLVKVTPTLSVSNWASLWLSGGYPGAGSIPGAAALANASTPGAVALPGLSAGQDIYLAGFQVVAPQGGAVVLIDRLAHNGGLSGIVITAQAVNTPALDGRYPDARNVMMALEVYAGMGATTTTATVTYTNSAGVAGRTATVAIAASMPIGRFLPITLQAGDVGVQSVQSVTLGASTGTAGNFGITLYRMLGIAPLANVALGTTLTFVDLGLQDIGTFATSSACLSMLFIPNTTTSGTIAGSVTVAVK